MGESVGNCEVDVHVLESGKIRQAQYGEYLARRKEDGLLWWVDVLVSDQEDGQKFLSQSLGFDPFVVEDVVQGHMRAGLFEHEDHAAFMVPVIEGECKSPQYKYIGVFICRTEFVTASTSPSETLANLSKHWRNEVNELGRTPAQVAYYLVDAAVDRYFSVLDDIHELIEDLEDEVYASSRLDNSVALSIKRKLLVMRKQISPLRDTIDAIMRHGPPLVPREMQRHFQDVYNHVLRVSDNIDLGRDILTSIMDAQLAVVSNRLNEVMRVLTVVSTLLMVCSLVAGIYGMNFTHMPELDKAWGYPASLGLMAVLSLFAWWLFKRKGFI